MHSFQKTYEAQSIKWRNIGVRRERKFEALIKKFNSGSGSIFRHLKDIMVFAALVGYSKGDRKPISSSDTIPIALYTYESDNQDSFIYLIALLAKKDLSILETENIAEAVKIFEEYCNAGLSIIENWLENESSRKIEDILLDKIYDQVGGN